MKANSHNKAPLLPRFWRYMPVVGIIMVVILAGLYGYLSNAKTTGIAAGNKAGDQESNRAPISAGHDNFKDRRGAYQIKGSKVQKDALVSSTFDTNLTRRPDRESKETYDKMHRPFSAHTMTEDEVYFKTVAVETMPVSNVLVHDTGVVFFWAEPKDAQNLQKRAGLMEDLAYLYRDSCAYEKPVTVVFLISGRPVQSQQFFGP